MPAINYSRTITLDAKTLASVQAGTAVIVVHGLDPATLCKQAQGEKSDLVPSLPLAATSPALCGTLAASQMSRDARRRGWHRWRQHRRPAGRGHARPRWRACCWPVRLAGGFGLRRRDSAANS